MVRLKPDTTHVVFASSRAVKARAAAVIPPKAARTFTVREFRLRARERT
jgi:hypothetical protein